jgi:hypothetical protein
MSIKVKGLDQALKGIERKGEAIQRAVIEVLADTASAIDFDAKTNAPSQIGVSGITGVQTFDLNIKQRIDKIALSPFEYKVGIQGTQDFDAYAEFGTGQDAREILNGPGYTDEMRAIAKLFYKNGQGTLIGQPFLFPAFLKNTANLVDELKQEMDKASKK